MQPNLKPIYIKDVDLLLMVENLRLRTRKTSNEVLRQAIVALFEKQGGS
jgi:hypothetical protein